MRASGTDQVVTVSVGISQTGLDGYDSSQLFAAANRRVYRAKSLGKSLVVSGSD